MELSICNTIHELFSPSLLSLHNRSFVYFGLAYDLE